MNKAARSLSGTATGSASRTRRTAREDIARLAKSLKTDAKGVQRTAMVIEATGARHRLPSDLTRVIARAAALLAEGKRVSVFAEDEMLTTQQAADRLNVSRQYLTRLIDRGDLRSIRVGTHRRVAAKDVAEFKKQRDAGRAQNLDELTALSERLDGYTLGADRR